MELKKENVGKLDIDIMSEVFFQYICESYGEQTALGILQYLEIDMYELHDKTIQSKILALLNGSVGSI
jgi:hypothetical protein